MSLEIKLKKSLNEKDVGNIYCPELDKIENSNIISPFGIDGLLQNKNISFFINFLSRISF